MMDFYEWTGEARFMAQSPKVRTYDLQPEMSEPEVAEHLVAAIRSGETPHVLPFHDAMTDMMLGLLS